MKKKDFCEEEETLSEEELEEIKIALEEVKRGEVYPIEDVAREFGITLPR